MKAVTVLRAARIAILAVVTQFLGVVSVFVMFASSPDYLQTLTMSLVFALLHVLSALVFLRTSPRWCALFIAPISFGLAIALVYNAGRFVHVFSSAASELFT